jgi:hypothetical protein
MSSQRYSQFPLLSSHCERMHFSPAVFAAFISTSLAYSDKATLPSNLYERATAPKTGFPPVSGTTLNIPISYN